MKWSQAASLTCRLSFPQEISFTTLSFLPAASERGNVGKRFSMEVLLTDAHLRDSSPQFAPQTSTKRDSSPTSPQM